MIGNENEIRSHYDDILRKAKKRFFIDGFKKIDPYLEALEEKVDIYSLSQNNLGQIEVPAELIVGTLNSARKTAFSRDFMPLLKPNTEFGFKWMRVAEYHLSDAGINEAPKAYEYLGKFYVEEGNKRVSVLKSYGAVYIPCNVIRLLPKKDDSYQSKLYYEFLDYYKLSRLYSIQFQKLGYYSKLIRLMGFEENHEFSRRERIDLVGLYERVASFIKKKRFDVNYADALIVLMEIYGYQELMEMTDRKLNKAINENRVKLIEDMPHYHILCVADAEDNYLWGSCKKEVLQENDFIISCGDLKSAYLEYLVTMADRPLFYVHGNHDEEYDTKPPLGCECIDDNLVVYKGLRIVGLGGSFKYRSGKYMYSEYEMRKRIKRLKRKIRKAGGIDIIVTHAPVKGYGDLNDYAHQGFECFKELIHEYHPKYLFFGHVHSNYDYSYSGIYEYEGTELINVSGKQKIVL